MGGPTVLAAAVAASVVEVGWDQPREGGKKKASTVDRALEPARGGLATDLSVAAMLEGDPPEKPTEPKRLGWGAIKKEVVRLAATRKGVTRLCLT